MEKFEYTSVSFNIENTFGTSYIQGVPVIDLIYMISYTNMKASLSGNKLFQILPSREIGPRLLRLL